MLRICLSWLVVLSLASLSARAGVGAYGNTNQRVNVQNRTTNHTINQNTNVNRNVNVNQNVNVNRNVNVHGGYYGGVVVQDNSWNWGSFAAGAAAGAVTTAAVSAATRPATTTVVATPGVGTVVTTLPAQCAVVAGAAGTIYNCANVYYRPYYQGTSLVYQVVTYP